MEIKPLAVPKESLTDRALAIGKALVGDFVPGGGTIGELAGMFIRSPYQKRTEEWQEQVGETLRQLAERGLNLEDLQSDPKFVDTVLHATQVALRNANEEKRSALRNAILNAGLPSAPEESKRQMFLNLVDTFTPWHIRLLKLFDNPKQWFENQGRRAPRYEIAGSLAQTLETAYPELRGQQEFYDQVWKELRAAGVVNTERLQGMMSGNGCDAQRTTPFGCEFVHFISEPPAK